MHLEDFSCFYCDGLWLGHLWWSSGNLDFTLVEHASLVFLVMSSGRMTSDSALGT